MAFNVEGPALLRGIGELLNFGMELPDTRAGDLERLGERGLLGLAPRVRLLSEAVRSSQGNVAGIYEGEATAALLKSLGLLESGKFSFDELADAMTQFGDALVKTANGVTKTQLIMWG
ncbi:hypothetical protein AB0C34_13980, partial [Nocardia sp. NPDC049220]|uniref:hypothetical protein n=1 Tax=Nocardia sp. NPDC049220 TaxID=3155273 RepID=UPI0033F20F70